MQGVKARLCVMVVFDIVFVFHGIKPRKMKNLSVITEVHYSIQSWIKTKTSSFSKVGIHHEKAEDWKSRIKVPPIRAGCHCW